MTVEPMPPVTYIRRFVMLSHNVLQAACRLSSPDSLARSAMPVYRYTARTAWPTASFCSLTGLVLWV